MAHIEAHDITLTYQTPSGAVPAVHGVSFGIEASEFLCITKLDKEAFNDLRAGRGVI